MDRRTALKVLGIATIGALIGKVAYAEDNIAIRTYDGTLAEWKKPNKIIWDMDEITIVEIHKGGETIEIKTEEIFEALKKL